MTKNGRTALHQVFLGVDPDGKFQRAELQLKPNETIEISLAERYEGLKTLVGAGNSRIENVGKVWVEFNSAYFEDGTLFEAGTLFKRNPNQNDLHKWIKIDNPYPHSAALIVSSVTRGFPYETQYSVGGPF